MNKIHRAVLATTATALVAMASLLPLAAQAVPVSFDVAGVQSLGAKGDAGNSVFNLNVGANAHITGVSYDVNLTAFAPSWLSEINVALGNSAETVGVEIAPGSDDAPGTASYAGSFDLVALGLDYLVGADGLLRLEFFDSFFDNASAAGDGIWNFGSITVNVADVAAVPEPASYALMGLALLALGANTMLRRNR